MKENQLQVILTEQNVGQENAKKLIEAFGAPFEEAGEILSTYQEIKVTGHKQVALMEEARTKRLALKKIRTGVENKRKELKEDALKAGRVIDAVARYVKETIQPAEEYLQLQEDFVKIEAEKAAAEKKAARLERLSPLVGDVSFYNYEEMTDEQFENLITERQEARAAAEKKRAEEEAEKKRAEEAEAKRIADQAKENARLKKEAEDREALERKRVGERSKQLKEIGMPVNEVIFGFRISGLDLAMSNDKEWKNLFAEAKDRIRMDKELKAKKAAEEAELEKEREARRKLEKEKQEKADADAKAAAEKSEAEKKALLAPDKDKLIAYAKSLGELPVPMLETEEAQAVMNNARNYVNTVAEKMTEKAKTL